MTLIGAPDGQRTVASAQLVLGTASTQTQTVALPANTETISIVVPGAASALTVTVTGVTTAMAYPVSDVAASNGLYVAAVYPGVDSSVTVDIGVSTVGDWYVVADSSGRAIAVSSTPGGTPLPSGAFLQAIYKLPPQSGSLVTITATNATENSILYLVIAVEAAVAVTAVTAPGATCTRIVSALSAGPNLNVEIWAISGFATGSLPIQITLPSVNVVYALCYQCVRATTTVTATNTAAGSLAGAVQNFIPAGANGSQGGLCIAAFKWYAGAIVGNVGNLNLPPDVPFATNVMEGSSDVQFLHVSVAPILAGGTLSPAYWLGQYQSIEYVFAIATFT